MSVCLIAYVRPHTHIWKKKLFLDGIFLVFVNFCVWRYYILVINGEKSLRIQLNTSLRGLNKIDM